MIRKSKLYSRPRRAYEKTRILEENKLLEKYGLKSKREVWKAIANLKYYRTRAKALAKASSEEQQVFFDKLQKYGLRTNSITDVLALGVEDLLARRLPTIMVEKKIAKTAQEARQMVTHKRVSIDGKIVNVPSYLVPLSEESLIKLKVSKPKPKAEKKTEEVAENGGN